MRIVLASKSPRRREILSRIVNEFEIITCETDETLPEGMHPCEGVRILAERKGAAVAKSLPADTLVISSDTLVELGGTPLGKPKDAVDAVDMLMTLSGNSHNVHTGVAVHYRGGVYSGVSSSKVFFRTLTIEEAEDYVKTGEPLDKAGSYAIQGIGKKFVSGYEGEFESIVGLSVLLTEKLINEATKND